MRFWAARTRFIGICACLALQGVPASGQGALTPIQIDPSLSQRQRTVHLEVFINDQTTNTTIELELDPAGSRLRTKRSELEAAGVKVPGEGGKDDPVFVDQLGYAFRFDEANQQLRLTLTDAQRVARDYDTRGERERIKPSIDPGFLLNYSLYGGSFRNTTSQLKFSGANASFDARAFSRFGVLSQSAIVGTTLYRESANFLRLDSTYTYQHPDTLLTGRAGDFVSNGLNWTRPVRMGGVQLQRDFAMRSDIVTRPIPVISGSAAAPSTVDVFINGTRSYSQDVGSGPFNLSNLPLMSGTGEARVVVRDAAGRETQTSMSLTNTVHLLRPGLYDFSVEAGFARRNYGILSDDYDRRPVASATLRRGINPWLTLETHAEGGAGLINGGAGLIAGIGPFGTLQSAFAYSRNGSASGIQLYAGWEGQFKWLNVNISSQRTFRTYQDLATVTAKIEPQQNTVLLPGGLILPVSASLSSISPMRAMDRISFSAPLNFDAGSVNLSFINVKRDDGQRNKLVTVSYNRPMPLKANFFLTGFADFGTVRSKGIFAGLTIPILSGIYATSGVSFDPYSRTSGSFELTKPQPLQDNTYGWRVRDVEGRNPYRMAQGSYRSSFGQVGGQVQQFGDRTEGNLTYDGSIAVMGGGVFFGNKVTNSFAVVDAGKPGIPVLQDNREVGRTNMFGKKLVSDLRAHETNSIAIDPASMPANYDVASTHAKVSPYAKSGVVVNFANQASQNAGLVVFFGADGKHVPTGSKGRLAATGEEFIVGYDGQAYIRNLAATNTATIESGARSCTSTFAFTPVRDRQSSVERAVCK